MIRFFEKLYKNGKDEFLLTLKDNLLSQKKTFIVTANSEIFMSAETQAETEALLLDDETMIIADGIGVVKGAEMLGITVKERIAGIELTEGLLKYADEYSKSVFLFGAEQRVLEELCRIIEEKYPNALCVGAVNGYTEDKDAVFSQIKESDADIILVALGVPLQEKLIYKHLNEFKKGIFMGVGGSFDVLSGLKKRAPKFFINHNIEWLYRILKEPKRIKRFYNSNVKFLFKIRAIIKDKRY